LSRLPVPPHNVLKLWVAQSLNEAWRSVRIIDVESRDMG